MQEFTPAVSPTDSADLDVQAWLMAAFVAARAAPKVAVPVARRPSVPRTAGARASYWWMLAVCLLLLLLR